MKKKKNILASKKSKHIYKIVFGGIHYSFREFFFLHNTLFLSALSLPIEVSSRELTLHILYIVHIN